MKVPDDLFHASFFFIDIVGLSKPGLSTQTQAKKIKFLNNCIKNCEAFSSNSSEKIIQSTGDGMLIAFIDGLDEPLKLAIEFHKNLQDYNQKSDSNDQVGVRIGCNIGTVFAVEDIHGNVSMWGPGVIIARRVMDLGESGHILVSSTLADRLKQISKEYEKIIHPIQDYTIKHEEALLIYSAFGDGFGNPNPPELQMGKKIYHSNENYNLRKTVNFKELDFNLKLKNPESNLLEISRVYNLIAASNENVSRVINGITTNIPKTMAELNVRIFDEKNKDVKIDSIQVASPLRKEFTIKLNEPLKPGQKNRYYNVIYEVGETKPLFEHMFLVTSEAFSLKFSYPSEKNLQPKLFHIGTKTRERNLVPHDPNIKKGLANQVTWKLESGVAEKDIIRLEW